MDEKKRLVDKSIEAFILGLEIYNKPTLRYRVEGFSFFIVNAWELMLKAELLNRNISLYYRDNPGRTLSIEKVIELIFPDKHGALRKNLEQIISLRNTSTHYITEDYEYIYAPLFQACVLNFVGKIQDFHKVDITTHIAQNFLTLSVRLEPLEDDKIRAKFSPEVASQIIKTNAEIKSTEEGSNNSYSIALDTRLYLTKHKKDADLAVSVSRDTELQAKIIREIKDPDNTHPYLTKEIISLVNKELRKTETLLTVDKNGQSMKCAFNTYHLKLFMEFYDIKRDQKYSYNHKTMNRYSYSPALVDFIVNIILQDAECVVSNLKKGIKKDNPGHM